MLMRLRRSLGVLTMMLRLSFVRYHGAGDSGPVWSLAELFGAHSHFFKRKTWIRRAGIHLAAYLKAWQFKTSRRIVFFKSLEYKDFREVREEAALFPVQLQADGHLGTTTERAHAFFLLDQSTEQPLVALETALSSKAFDNLSLVWTDQEPKSGMESFLPFAERTAGERAMLSYSASRRIHSGLRDHVSREGSASMPRIPYAEARRRINDLAKHAAPYKLLVAVALEEDSDGFCDASLLCYLPALEDLAGRFPGIAFFLLNPTTKERALTHSKNASPLIPARCRGLDVEAALLLAQDADAFIGTESIYSIVALSAGRPSLIMRNVSGASPSVIAKSHNHIVTSMLAPDTFRWHAEQVLSLLTERPTTVDPVAQAHADMG
jgi:hypothetical protein